MAEHEQPGARGDGRAERRVVKAVMQAFVAGFGGQLGGHQLPVLMERGGQKRWINRRLRQHGVARFAGCPTGDVQAADQAGQINDLLGRHRPPVKLGHPGANRFG